MVANVASRNAHRVAKLHFFFVCIVKNIVESQTDVLPRPIMSIITPFFMVKHGNKRKDDCLIKCLKRNGCYNSQVSKLKPILLVLIFNSLEIFNAISRTWVWLIPSVLLWRASPMEPYMGIQWFWMILIQTSCYIKSLKISNYHIQVLIAMVSSFHKLLIVYNYLLFESNKVEIRKII